MTSEVFESPRLKAGALLGLTGMAAVVAGALASVRPALAVAGMVGAGLAVGVWRRPAVAAVLYVGITPFVVGIDRGKLIPLLRPNEAVLLALAAILAARGLVRAPSRVRMRDRLGPLDWSLVLMAVAASFVPLVWMAARGQSPTGDDISYALVLWKFLAVYVLVRVSVRADREVLWCLVASVAAATVVGVIGILQALDLLGIRGLLMDWYIPEGTNQVAIEAPRAGATVALPAAAADLLVFNLAIVAGIWYRVRRHGFLLAVPVAVYLPGVFAAGEFSSVLALLVGVIAVAAALRRLDLLRYAPFLLVGTGVMMWPVIEHRLIGFQGVSGLPVSWTTRLSNLRTYFWPEIFSGPDILLGVRPAARVRVPTQDTGYVWIESGYTWLLWGGGIPLLAAFVHFARTAGGMTLRRCRSLSSWSSVAALASFAAVNVVVVTMIFDPHLTYRGSADALFALLALSMTAGAEKTAGADIPAARQSVEGGDR
ncbi:hypothetical protein KRR39_07285 [Nocardioides panacis]|uniref:Uncharacterized protein n=1 Tax=Nocardioides panacis TaxID=2849501 RepID=A0A975Y1I5_9ACTN|nr:hypothetical protein [Nocardioides panacis]QWZ09547.1 hypothetical protein KRR39_07285 [Nocardioides panacis]